MVEKNKSIIRQGFTNEVDVLPQDWVSVRLLDAFGHKQGHSKVIFLWGQPSFYGLLADRLHKKTYIYKYVKFLNSIYFNCTICAVFLKLILTLLFTPKNKIASRRQTRNK